MGKIILDYFMPITSIEPTPQVATGFLKQACLVVKKNGGGTDGVITLCTTMSGVSAVTDNEEAQQLFDAGMSKVYILCSPDLDLADALDGHGEFFTVLISSDFGDSDFAQDVTTPAVAASVHFGELTYTAKHSGLFGNDITVEYVDDAEEGEEIAHAVDKAITVHISDGASTCTMIKAAIDDSVSASALVTVAIDSGEDATGQSIPDPNPQDLAGGVATIFTDGTGIQVGTFGGVIGYSGTDDDVLAVEAATSKRAVFHTTSENKAANMLYAFGKLLSNALNWRNQQYITMPEADDIDTLGEANTLFDAKINFVISDDEFGNRLSLFAVGGKAIVAPYIIRNLELDFQSAGLSFISGNEPAYTKKMGALLEDELYKVIQLYIDRQWIEAGTVEILLENDNFVASGNINIAEPKAMWRVFAEMRQTL